jgi:hypothetical protein
MSTKHKNKLATPAEWEDILARGGPGAVAEAAESDSGDADESVVAGDGVSVNGVVVPALLLERSKAARARLSA